MYKNWLSLSFERSKESNQRKISRWEKTPEFSDNRENLNPDTLRLIGTQRPRSLKLRVRTVNFPMNLNENSLRCFFKAVFLILSLRGLTCPDKSGLTQRVPRFVQQSLTYKLVAFSDKQTSKTSKKERFCINFLSNFNRWTKDSINNLLIFNYISTHEWKTWCIFGVQKETFCLNQNITSP